MATITVDSRESRSDVPNWLVKLGHEITTEEMPVGDYALRGHFVLERKEANDFVASILDGRLFGQAELLASQQDRPIVIIEGDLTALWSRIEPEAIAGALSALLTFFHLPIITSASAENSARLIGRLAKHHVEGLGYEIALRTRKPKTDGGLAQYLVEGLPGVGAETARKLITHFGSPRAVFTASYEQLIGVKGIGKKTAQNISHALDARPTGFRVTATAVVP